MAMVEIDQRFRW